MDIAKSILQVMLCKPDGDLVAVSKDELDQFVSDLDKIVFDSSPRSRELSEV